MMGKNIAVWRAQILLFPRDDCFAFVGAQTSRLSGKHQRDWWLNKANNIDELGII
ncbi:MAG: hypothetical protein ACNA8H_13850 [Anaerolineales bacterium]